MQNNLKSVLAKTSIKFGTSGARGLVSDFSCEISYLFAQAFWKACGHGDTVVVGHDLRPSSPEIARACLAYFRDVGVKTIFVGPLPTPAVALYAQIIKAPAVVVTGSHIPFERNGLKFYGVAGEITKADEVSILSQELERFDSVVLNELPPVNEAAHKAYVDRHLEFFPNKQLSGKTVAVYQHSSVARDIVVEILEGLGAETIALGRTDRFTPVDTEAVTPHDMEAALKWASDFQFDALVTTDGDGDRPLIADENGCWLRGDTVGLLCAQALGADFVVTPVSCNTSAELCGKFLRVDRTKIGSPYVIESIDEVVKHSPSKIVVGYEANGGFILGSSINAGARKLEALPTRDAMLPIVLILQESQRKAVAISGLLKGLPQRFTASDRLVTPTNPYSLEAVLSGLQRDEELQGLVMNKTLSIASRNSTDGMRAVMTNGEILHIRPSGNAPELRIYAESDSAENARAMVSYAVNRLTLMLV